MSVHVTLYHNNRCSKSRDALAMLHMRGVHTEVVNYLDTPPTQDTLRSLFELLGAASPRDMMRTNEGLYRELGLNNPSLSDEQLLQAIAEHPKLLERPIAVVNGRAAIGRPLENIEALLP